jgi:hypothetical protein
MLILFVGHEHIFTWAGREQVTVAEKAAYWTPRSSACAAC